jgi:hypothetical protein
MSKETVNHPAHYNVGGIEVIDAIESWGLGFHEGNVVKYVARARYKANEVEDLKKAAWYLNRIIEQKEKKNAELSQSVASRSRKRRASRG